MKYLASDTWLWINGIQLVVLGLLGLTPGVKDLIPLTIPAAITVVFGVLSILISFLKRDDSKLNSKLWLLLLGLMLCILGLTQFFQM